VEIKMASLPGETGGDLPNFEIDSIEGAYYDPEIIANEAVWPLLNNLWQGDWQKEAFPGQSFEFPKAGVDETNQMLDIRLIAEQALDDGVETGETELCSETSIIVDEIVQDPRRTLIIKNLIQNYPSAFEVCDIDKLIVRRGVSYSFDTDGNSDIDVYQEVESIEGNVLWHSLASYEEGENEEDEEVGGDMFYEQEVKFRDHDIDTLKTAFKFLGASVGLIETLEWIKQEPIDPV
jgi:hypothetical protein